MPLNQDIVRNDTKEASLAGDGVSLITVWSNATRTPHNPGRAGKHSNGKPSLDAAQKVVLLSQAIVGRN